MWILRCATVALFATLIAPESAIGQARLPFTGTRTYCDVEAKESKAVVSIRSDGFAEVRTNMWADRGKVVTFAGKLDSKWILRRNATFTCK